VRPAWRDGSWNKSMRRPCIKGMHRMMKQWMDKNQVGFYSACCPPG
jgi:hypothetical protein